MRSHPLAILSVFLLTACATKPSPQPQSTAPQSRLFDGQSLARWEGDTRHWRVEDGTITGETTAETTARTPTYLIWRGGTVQDFELRVVYRFVTPGNSGVQYRSQEAADFMVTGYQADFETSHGQKWTGALVEMGGRLHLALRGQKAVVGPDGKPQVTPLPEAASLDRCLKNDGWNEYVVVARGNHHVHELNGCPMSEVVDGEQGARSGILALQLSRHQPMKVQFQTVELRPL